jgi:hypothetical protein
MPELTLNSVVARRDDLLTAAVDNDLVMLDAQEGNYFGVERVGHRIWQLLDQPRTAGDVCSELEREFDVPSEHCRADVFEFLGQLQDANLVEIR